MQISNVRQLWVVGTTFILDYEMRMAEFYEGLPAVASTPEFKKEANRLAREAHLYADNIRAVLQAIGEQPASLENAIAKGMRKATETMTNLSIEGPVRDAAIIVELNQQTLFRVATYGSMLTYATLLGEASVLDLIRQALEGSKAADVRLTQLAQDIVNPAAMQV